METIKELRQAERKVKDLLKHIENIADILINDSLTLQDIIANEEDLDNRCYELQQELKHVINLRQWLDFENAEKECF